MKRLFNICCFFFVASSSPLALNPASHFALALAKNVDVFKHPVHHSILGGIKIPT